MATSPSIQIDRRFVRRAFAAAACLFVALPAIARGQATVRHTVTVDVPAFVSIRDALVSPDTTAPRTAWTWSGSVTGNAPFALQVEGPGAGSSLSVRIAGGTWTRMTPATWHTVAEGPPGRHRMVLEFRSDEASPSPSNPPRVRAVAR